MGSLSNSFNRDFDSLFIDVDDNLYGLSGAVNGGNGNGTSTMDMVCFQASNPSSTAVLVGTSTVSIDNVSTDGALCRYASVPPPRQISGYVYEDQLTQDIDGVSRQNGSKDAGEPGISGVTITLYDLTDDVCQQTTTDGSGYYQFTVGKGHEYEIYETADAGAIDCSTGPPSFGSLDKSTGSVVNNDVADPSGYGSITPNKIVLGTVDNDSTNNNFGNFVASQPFDTCSITAYLSNNSPTATNYSQIDLISGERTNINSSSPATVHAMGYSVRQQRIWGVSANYNDLIAINSQGDTVARISNADVPTQTTVAAVTDDDILVLVTNNALGRQLRFFDVNPNSASYLTEVGIRSGNIGINVGDIAVHPTDGTLWMLSYDDRPHLYKLVLDSTGVNAQSITDVGETDLPNGSDGTNPGALYFDKFGYLFVVMEGASAHQTFRLDITNLNSPSLSAELMGTDTFSANDNIDGASCRYNGVEPNKEISGYVFTDTKTAGVNGFQKHNGQMDGGEVGIGGVTITLLDVAENICYQVNTSDGSSDINGDGITDPLGYYYFDGKHGKEYKIFETANASSIDCSLGEPSAGIQDAATGVVSGAEIADPTGYLSSSPNVIHIPLITTNIDNQNFADVPFTQGLTCDNTPYFAIGSGTDTDLHNVNLTTGSFTDVTLSEVAMYTGLGYSTRNHWNKFR